MLEDLLPNVSVTQIQVNTKFKPQIEEGDDIRTEVIKSFHNAIHYLIEKYLTENEEFEGRILEIMGDRGELPRSVKEFSDLGEISIQIIEKQSVVLKQMDLSEDGIKDYLTGQKVLDKNQTKLVP